MLPKLRLNIFTQKQSGHPIFLCTMPLSLMMCGKHFARGILKRLRALHAFIP